MIANGGGHAAHPFDIFAVVGGASALLDFSASGSESLDGIDGFLGIGLQRFVCGESLQIGLGEIGEQGLAVGAAVKVDVFTGLSRYGDNVRRTRMIDKKHTSAFPDRHVRA